MKNFSIFLFFCFLYGSEYVHGYDPLGTLGIGRQGTSPLEKFNPRDVAASTGDAVIGIAKQVPQSIPTPETVLSYGKNLVAGMPIEVAFDVINKACKYRKNVFKKII